MCDLQHDRAGFTDVRTKIEARVLRAALPAVLARRSRASLNEEGKKVWFKMIAKGIIKFFAIYIIQVGSIWGFVEGYTYFRGDHLKKLLGPYWVILYGLPAIIALIATIKQISKIDNSANSHGDIIITKGKYSPGKVGGNYEVNIHEQKKRKN